MTSPAQSVRPSDPVSRIVEDHVVAQVDLGATLVEVAEELAADEIGAVLVGGPHGPVGVLSERDIVTELGNGGDPGTRQAADVMNPDILWAAADDTVREVARRMCEAGVRHIPVRKGDSLIGLVSIRDVLRVIVEADQP